MCLIINSRFHKSLFGHYLPKIATTNILVFKYLQGIDPHIVTPYQRTPCTFEDGQCTLKVNRFTYDEPPFDNCIKEGIYAAIEKNCFISPFTSPFPTKAYFAIIPRGTLYYIGTYNDIVSKKLIIFTDIAFKEWHKKK